MAPNLTLTLHLTLKHRISLWHHRILYRPSIWLWHYIFSWLLLQNWKSLHNCQYCVDSETLYIPNTIPEPFLNYIIIHTLKSWIDPLQEYCISYPSPQHPNLLPFAGHSFPFWKVTYNQAYYFNPYEHIFNIELKFFYINRIQCYHNLWNP